MQVQLKCLTPTNSGSSSGSEFMLDFRCYRKLKRKVKGKWKIKQVKYSFYDCDAVIVVIQKPPALPEAEEPTTYLIIPKTLLVSGGCMVSEAESGALSSLDDHPKYHAAEKTIPVGTKAFLRGPVSICSDLQPLSVGRADQPGNTTDVINAGWK